jgi:hypothetical protein
MFTDAGTFFPRKIFSERVQEGLMFFFRLRARACDPGDV